MCYIKPRPGLLPFLGKRENQREVSAAIDPEDKHSNGNGTLLLERPKEEEKKMALLRNDDTELARLQHVSAMWRQAQEIGATVVHRLDERVARRRLDRTSSTWTRMGQIAHDLLAGFRPSPFARNTNSQASQADQILCHGQWCSVACLGASQADGIIKPELSPTSPSDLGPRPSTGVDCVNGCVLRRVRAGPGRAMSTSIEQRGKGRDRMGHVPCFSYQIYVRVYELQSGIKLTHQGYAYSAVLTINAATHIMSPEGGEVTASYFHIATMFCWLGLWKPEDAIDGYTYRDSSDPWPVLGLWADHTKSERQELSRLGPLPERISKNQAVQVQPPEPDEAGPKLWARGNMNDRGSVWPLDIKSLHELELLNVHLSAKSLVFNFKECYLEMAYLTHTSLQLYRRDVWEERVVDLPATKSHRGFKIIMAIEFPEYVLAFLTKDLVAKPTWTRQRPEMPPEVYPGFNTDLDALPYPHEWWVLLAQLVKDVLEKGPDKCLQLAIHALRTIYGNFFPGMGAFTINEIFFMAGLSPSLTIGEVVGNPSRFARFVEAYYVFMWRVKKDYWSKVLCRTFHLGHLGRKTLRFDDDKNTIMSPEVEHRLDFARDYLYVHAKPDVRVHARHARLIQEYNSWVNSRKLSSTSKKKKKNIYRLRSPHDPFEPSYLDVAFRRTPNLSHLIFGGPLPSQMDPITAAYAKGFTLRVRRPNLPTYSQVVLPRSERTLRVDTYFYPVAGEDVATSQGQIWSVILPGPNNEPQHSMKFREQKLFKNIVHTKAVAIGPLEYCGYAPPIRNGRKIVYETVFFAAVVVRLLNLGFPCAHSPLVCHRDPILIKDELAHVTVQRMQGEVRKSLQFPGDQRGGAIRALTDAETDKLRAALRVEWTEQWGAENLHILERHWRYKKVGSAPTAAPTKQPRKRKTADFLLTTEGTDKILGEVSNVRSKRQRK
ncbi:hypothetical protein EXIGLDRAFT_702734 [Exidia glandulosa HHB12029]|uniref:Uncharacterized protein n=1 Tax=Exidia glandulosa HHB12029 TaxID=1314781 RepID=A0A165CE65_EXIGL|nr:hypothetical protein EXIGLDRAFT_702734 [Exidia glandulosa HHB12029]